MKGNVVIVRNALFAAWIYSTNGIGFAGADGQIFTYQGKNYSVADVEPASRQALYDADKEHYDAITRVVEDAILTSYVKEEAQKRKTTEAEVKNQLFSVAAPDEKAMTAWYEKNKEKIPYPYDKIKSEISRMLQGEEQNKKRTSLLEDLKKKGNFKILFPQPVAPSFQIASQGFPVKGNKDAKVTIVEFADFQCPHCKHASEVVKTVMAKYGDRVKLVYLDYPINPSGISRKVAEGAVCADEQGKYWEYHSMAFERQTTLTATSPSDFAKELKLDTAKFAKCLASSAPKDKVAKAEDEGRKVGVQGTPSFYINGRRMQGGDEQQFTAEIDNALKG